MKMCFFVYKVNYFMTLTISNIAIVKMREENLLLLTPDLLLHGGLLTEQFVHGALQLLSVSRQDG
jgi:hypothetical protein